MIWQPIATAPKDEWILMTEWRPIETAPKDGTDVLVWCGGAMFIAYMEVGRWFFDRTDHSVKPLPTHWMPLPPAPKKGDK